MNNLQGIEQPEPWKISGDWAWEREKTAPGSGRTSGRDGGSFPEVQGISIFNSELPLSGTLTVSSDVSGLENLGGN